jgi:hypothetical protein
LRGEKRVFWTFYESIKFYVLTSSLKGKKQDRVTQKLKLKLKVEQKIVDKETGKKKKVPLKISGKVKKNS